MLKILKKFQAKVIRGQGRGRGLGYPTANLDKTDLDLPHGVYIVKTAIAQRKEHYGLMHFGPKAVFKEPVSLEIWIKDFVGDLYGAELAVAVIKKLRETEEFADPAALTAAIDGDRRALEDFVSQQE